MIKRLVLILCTVVLFAASAFAKLPEEVLTPYKAYRAALEQNDNKTATKQALAAWEAAEELLGDHKATGDLALNYANIMPNLLVKNPYKNYQTRAKAYRRSIELAHFYGDEAHIIEIQRRLYLADLDLTVTRHRISAGGRKNKSVGSVLTLKNTKDAISDYNLNGSTFDADLHVLYARYYQLNDKPEKAVEYSQKAINLFETRTDGYFSKYEFFVRIYKGDSHLSLSKKDEDIDQSINAALEYQVVMQNLEGKLPAKHPFIREAFTGWMRTRSDIENAGMLEKAEAAGLCECWPFENYKNKVVPLKRIPPIMPRNARRSGHVYVTFDVKEDGTTENIKAASASDKVFEEPALKSVQAWEYSRLDAESDPENRKNISSKITFILSDSRGNRIPE